MSQTDQDKATAAHGKIIARAWRDPAAEATPMTALEIGRMPG